MNIYKQIYKVIKKYNTIVIARHIGADPDALGSEFSLKSIITRLFPEKKVYAVGNPASRFKFFGSGDKLDNIDTRKALLIVVDTPDIKRIDGVSLNNFEYVIKIDHHPVIDKYANIECIDTTSCSSSQMILEFVYANKIDLVKEEAEKLFLGIVGDTDRFLHDYTSVKTFELVTRMLKDTNIDFTSLYKNLYQRPLAEIKFEGYIYSNMTINDNGLAYIKLTDKVMKEYNVDVASAGNMINNLKFVNGITVWIFLSEDVKNNLIKANIRSVGPIVNELATKFGGGGHIYASGAKLKSWDEADKLINDFNLLLNDYNDKKLN